MTPGQFLTEVVQNRYSRRDVIRRATLLGFSLPVIGALLTACGDEDDSAVEDDSPGAQEDTPSADEEETDGDDSDDSSETPAGGDDSGSSVEASGSIAIALAAEPLTLENWNAFSVNAHPMLRNIMEALTNRDPETNDLVPELATSWEQVDDTTWRFQIREGVTFHNGEELNAEVVAFGLNYTWDPENGFEILAILGPELTAEAVDEYTVDVTTAEPDPILPTRLYFSPIPSMTQIQEDPESAQDNPIGTGPYTFVEWVKGQHVRITANPDWWGHNADDAGGKITIKDAEFLFRTEPSVRASQLSAGETQLTNNLTPEDCQVVPVCEQVPSIETIIFRLDTMHVAMSDIRVREAIALAIDMESVATNIFEASEPATHIYSPAATGYNPDLEPYPYDPDRATALIEEARADGVPVDAPITIVTTGTIPRTPELVQHAASQLQQIGLDVSTQILESAQYRPEVYGKAQNDVSEDRGWIVQIGHGNELMDASASIDRYYSCNPDSDSTYCNKEVDQMSAEAAPLTDAERDEAYQEIAAELHDDFAIIPVIHQEIIYGLAENLDWSPRLDGFMLLKEMSYR